MANTQTGSLLKYLGLMGTSGVHTGSLVPRAKTPDADQRLWSDFLKSGEVSNPDIWSKFNSIMKRPTTFESMLNMWDEMSQWELLAAALVEIVDEATQVDALSPGMLWYQCNKADVEDELNDMLVRINAEQNIPSQVWHVAALGNSFEKLEYAPQEGIIGTSYVHPMDMRRYWLERNRKCIGFRWLNHKPDKEDVYVSPDNKTPIERVSLASGQTTEDLYYPWDFMHFRRMYRMRTSEHGEPIFAEADGIYKKLRLAIDQMVVCRAQIQPDRYAISIDVQEQPPAEQMKTVNRWRQLLRSKIAFGQAGSPDELNSASDFSSYYNSLALDTILYIAQPKGFSNAITKVPGTAEVPDVYDIELLTDLFYSIIGMPKAWFGGNSGDGKDYPSGKALLAQDIRFLRKIKSIRKPIMDSYQWLAYFHEVLRGKDISQLEIKAMMPPVGSLEEQMKMELLSTQADVLSKLGDVMEQYNLPKEAWIETVFKRYMHLPDEVVNVFMTALPGEAKAQEESNKAKSAPATKKLVEQIESKLKHDVEGIELIADLNNLVYGKHVRIKPFAKWTKESVVNFPSMKENDIVVSSFGRHPFDFKRPSQMNLNESTKTSVGGGTITERMKEPSKSSKTKPSLIAEAMPAPVTENNENRSWSEKYGKFI
jgi:hypothetical protein